jgi:hypothetical protein
MTTVGVPRDALARATYFKRVGVRFADGFYSLDDIEHGLLRGNVESSRGFFHFGGTRRPIERGDPREAHVVRWDASSFSNKKHPTLRDPRVHFALNCGARSCPPVSFYEGETLDEALQTAAEGFCEDDANVDVVANTTTNKTTVRLSKLFSWYRGDFGASDAEVLERVQDWCPRGSAKKKALLTSLTALANTVNDDARKKKKRRIEISYAPYDWSVDATADSPTYASANARESWGRFTGSFWESFWS